MTYGFLQTPLGTVFVAARPAGICRCDFAAEEGVPPGWLSGPSAEHPVHDPSAHDLAQAISELRAYFEGRLRAFSCPLAPDGTPFQRAVWSVLAEIPFGQTRTYGQVAHAVGRPTAARAAGAACARNPVALLIPCHRVVGGDGGLTGYAGGLGRKRWLLSHEAGGQTGAVDVPFGQVG